MGMAEDLAEFARVATLREKPTWAQTHARSGPGPSRDCWIIRHRRHRAVPTLVLPPQAGHASSIVDYGRDQSQMMTLRDGGLDRLFAIDWLPATDETADWSIEGYVAVLEEAVQFLGGRVNLVGDCQGGWLAVVYAGLHPEQREHDHDRWGADRHTCRPVGNPGMDSTACPAQRTRGVPGAGRAGGGVQRGEHQLAVDSSCWPCETAYWVRDALDRH